MDIEVPDYVEYDDEINCRQYLSMVVLPMINQTFPDLQLEMDEVEQLNKFIFISFDGVKIDPETGNLYNEIDVTVPAYCPGNRSRDHLGNLPYIPTKFVGSVCLDGYPIADIEFDGIDAMLEEIEMLK